MNLLLSQLRTDIKFMLDLPHGNTTFAFVLDMETESLLDSRIHAIGFLQKVFEQP